MPHPGKDFADLWATFSTGPRQAPKPISALQLMLDKLGRKPEAFAVVMLESAIQGDWSGIENPGTPRAFAEWLAGQAKTPTAPPVVPVVESFKHDLVAEQSAAAEAALANRLARYETANT